MKGSPKEIGLNKKQVRMIPNFLISTSWPLELELFLSNVLLPFLLQIHVFSSFSNLFMNLFTFSKLFLIKDNYSKLLTFTFHSLVITRATRPTFF